MPDFTLKTYTKLLEVLQLQGYQFLTFAEFLKNPDNKTIVIRHDVDNRPQNSLKLAKFETQKGLKGSYYFRAKPRSWNEKIIKEIAELGHEIGYHYEELATYRGNLQKAIKAFETNLENLRKLAPVTTMCMHGSPTSKHDPRDLWREFDYKEYQIKGEPYFDVDYSNTLYLSDTGRSWNGHNVSIRDKVDMKQKQILREKGYHLRKTKDIIRAAEEKALPHSIIFTIHPQRWHSNKVLWLQELILQNLKNVAKRILVSSSPKTS